ncbi:MAG: RraA family protein [Acidimicrobiales bacterium]
MAHGAQEMEAAAKELIELGAATVGESGGRAMSSAVRAVWSGARLCAPAYTARCTGGDNLAVHTAVARAPRGSALVVSVDGVEEFGYWGEVLTTAAEARGLAGLVIGGGVRDVSALEAHEFPVFATRIALKGAAKVAGGETGTEVEVGGVIIRTRDWVLGDADGVVVIDGQELDAVIGASRARAQKEERIFGELQAGRTTVELLGLDTSSVRGEDGAGPGPG